MARPPIAALAVLGLALASPAAAAPRVVVTIKPLHSLVAAVMDGIGAPTLLLDAAVSEHTAALKPSQIAALETADVVVANGAGLEAFWAKALAGPALQGRTVVELARTPGLTRLALREGGAWEPHAEDEAQGEASEGFDPHVWLDPRNAKLMVRRIADALAQADPAQAAAYETNAATYAAALDDLDRELAAALKPLDGKAYVVFHDGYQYFEARYGLDPQGSITVNPELPPGARRLARIRSRLAAIGPTCVFAEPQFESKYLATVIEGTAAKAGVLDGLGAGLAPGPQAYPAILRGIARNLLACLSR